MNTNPCARGARAYIWSEGDTFAAVAARYGVSESDLRALNANYTGEPQSGETVCLPAARCPNGRLYVVHRGDSFTSIAAAYGISVERLSAANPFVDPDAMAIGQVLCVPLPEQSEEGETEEEQPPQQEESGSVEGEEAEDCVCISNLARYQVLEGESYVDLLMKTCMPYLLFRFLNPQLTPGDLREGQTYYAPKESLCGMVEPRSSYQIQPGQDLFSAARALDLSAGALLSRNPQLAPADFTPGTVIRF